MKVSQEEAVKMVKEFGKTLAEAGYTLQPAVQPIMHIVPITTQEIPEETPAEVVEKTEEQGD